MNNKYKLIVILATGILLSLSLTFLLSQFFHFGPRRAGAYMSTFHSMKIFLTSLNVILIGVLFVNYVSIYEQMRSKFTLSLIIFSLSLLLYALSSHPLFHLFFGFRGSGLGPFQVIPNFFSLIAVTILLYQSFD